MLTSTSHSTLNCFIWVTCVYLKRLFPSIKRQHDAANRTVWVRDGLEKVQQSSVHTFPWPHPEMCRNKREVIPSDGVCEGDAENPSVQDRLPPDEAWSSDAFLGSEASLSFSRKPQVNIWSERCRSPSGNMQEIFFKCLTQSNNSHQNKWFSLWCFCRRDWASLNRSWLRVCCGFNAIQVCLNLHFVC